MTAHDVLKRALAAGVTLAADGAQLRLQAEKKPPSELIEELRAHKAEILDLLRTPPRSPEGLITAWRASIACVATDLPEVSRLKTVSLRFLDGSNVAAAIENEWNEVSLFGVHRGGYPKERLDCWGLTAFLAWGTHSYTIQAFTREECSLLTRSGSLLKLQRVRPNHDQATSFWTHPAFCNPQSERKSHAA